ncbi:hypothetical protein Tco_0383352 [Tanacetum coccineum]
MIIIHLGVDIVQFEPHIQSSKAKRAVRNHDLLELIARSNASSQSHASPSYSNSPQPYYVTHPSSVVDYEEDYQGELQGDSQEDKLTSEIILLARAITQKFFTPTNNRLRTSSNTRNQAMIQDGIVDIQTKNAEYGGNSNRNAGRQNRNQAFNAGNVNDESNHIVQRVPRTKLNPRRANVQCYNCNEKCHYAHDYEILEELTVAIIMMAQIQQADDNAVTKPTYDAKAVSKLEREMHADKDTIERILKEKDKIESDFFKIEKEKIIIQHETQLAKKAFKEQENRYLEDIVDLKEKLSSHDRIVYKMGQSIQTIHMLGKTPNKVYDPFLKAGLVSLSKTLKELQQELIEKKNELLKTEIEKSSSDSKDIQANLLKRIKILENYFKRSQAQSIDFELKLQHQKEKMACDVSWKSRLSRLNDKNVLLKTQVDYVVKERENIKLEYQKLFNSIKATRTQHQKEVDELIEHVNQKTYTYGDVRSQNQDLLMIISELKNKLKTIEKGKNMNTKFDKSETLGKLICVTPLNTNTTVKAKKVSNTKVNADRSKPVTSHSTPKNEQSVESSNSVRRPKSKDTKSKNKVLKNTNDKSSSVHDRKVSNVFMFSHEKCVARYALSRDSKVKRALFTTPVAAKSKNLGATSVVVKSRLSDG